jgi:hypothetical protein
LPELSVSLSAGDLLTSHVGNAEHADRAVLQDAPLVREQLRGTRHGAGRGTRGAGSTVGHVVGGLGVGTGLVLGGVLLKSVFWGQEAGETHGSHLWSFRGVWYDVAGVSREAEICQESLLERGRLVSKRREWDRTSGVMARRGERIAIGSQEAVGPLGGVVLDATGCVGE